MTRRFIKTTPLACVLLAATLVIVVQAGDLNPPPGPVMPTMKTLTEVEPRIAIHVADLPLTINQAGSYYLAENILTKANGIVITTSNVTIDLMGFALSGGTGDGISAAAGLLTRILHKSCDGAVGSACVVVWLKVARRRA